jgi:hypothetical protein
MVKVITRIKKFGNIFKLPLQQLFALLENKKIE